jgi:small-conductance mechanosensitive channel
MNEYFSDPSQRGGFDAMYYWEQFQPIVAALAILLVGWIIALIIAAGVKKLLQRLETNHRLSSATGSTPNIENLVSKLVFWFVMILALVGALNVLNISGVSDPFSNMVSRVLAFLPSLLAAVAVGFVGWIVARLVRAGLPMFWLEHSLMKNSVETSVLVL